MPHQILLLFITSANTSPLVLFAPPVSYLYLPINIYTNTIIFNATKIRMFPKPALITQKLKECYLYSTTL